MNSVRFDRATWLNFCFMWALVGAMYSLDAEIARKYTKFLN